MSRLNKSSCGLILCYVTNRESLDTHKSGESLEILSEKIEAAMAAGVNWIQLREKNLSGKDCSALSREALQRAAKLHTGKATRTRILVNDRLDVALSEHAGGVHLGEKSLPPVETRRLVENCSDLKDFVIGVSCHSLEAAKSAASAGADYLFFGPIFATPSKVAFGSPQGLERLAEVCRAVSIPVLAIGGITLANASLCLAAGASGIAAIRLFQDANDISSIVRTLLKQAP